MSLGYFGLSCGGRQALSDDSQLRFQDQQQVVVCVDGNAQPDDDLYGGRPEGRGPGACRW